ncbi:MAG: FAD-dependent oxidoreductase [Peptostreptococcaceae bacterium]|nr:FAD-dependent oxidoreductase [Peptostreptococcaceae bacterium]
MGNEYDVVIIGGGTAGLTAGMYAARANKKTLIIEKAIIGGQITYTHQIDNFPAAQGLSGVEYSMKLQEQAESFGAKIELDEILDMDYKEGDIVLKGTSKEYHAKALILATGLKHRRMGVEREESLIGSGISFCAVCDGAFFKDAEVAVYGGGNTALEDAIFLSDTCKKVTIIHRRDQFRGEEHLEAVLRSKPNVEFAMNKTVSKIHGEYAISGLTLHDKVTGQDSELNISGLFVAIGQIPDSKPFDEMIETDRSGFFDNGENCKTSKPGIFVAGDCRTKDVRQLTTAAADGSVAAVAACSYVDSIR